MAKPTDPFKRSFRAFLLVAFFVSLPVCLCAADLYLMLLQPDLSPRITFHYPLLKAFLLMAIAALLAVALLKRRHRPELLAVCLALSIILHLLALSLFSFMSFRRAEMDNTPEQVASRVRVGTPVHRELVVSHMVRTQPLKVEWVTAQKRLVAERALQGRMVKDEATKSQPDLRSVETQPAQPGEFTTPGAAAPARKPDEQLKTPANRLAGEPLVKIALPQKEEIRPQPATVEPAASKALFDVRPVTRTAEPRVPAKPRAVTLGIQEQGSSPKQAEIDTVAVQQRQPEIKEGIQALAERLTPATLELKAEQIANNILKNHAVTGKGADIKLSKRGGLPPEIDSPNLSSAPQAADQPGIPADSLAGGRIDLMERKAPDISGFSPADIKAAAIGDPIRINQLHPLAATPEPGPNASVPGSSEPQRRELTASRLGNVSVRINAADEKPLAEIGDATLSREPIRIGVEGEPLVKPRSTALVGDRLSEVSTERSSAPSLKTTIAEAAMISGEKLPAAHTAEKTVPSALAAAKVAGGMAGTRVDELRLAPQRGATSREIRAPSATLIKGPEAVLPGNKSSSGMVAEQLTVAPSDGGGLIEARSTDIVAPARVVKEPARGGYSNAKPGMQTLDFNDGRRPSEVAVVEKGALESPLPDGRGAFTETPDSFVGAAKGVGALTAKGAAFHAAEQLDSSAALPLRSENASVVPGRMPIERQSGQDIAITGIAERQADREPSELVVGKVAQSADSVKDVLPGPLAMRHDAIGEPSALLAEASAVTIRAQPAGHAAAAEAAGHEALAMPAVSVQAFGLSAPAPAAPAVIPRGASRGDGKTADIIPSGGETFQVAKVGATDQFMFEPQGGGGLWEGTESKSAPEQHDIERLDMNPGVNASRARVTSDISASPLGQEERRSFLSVGTTPDPEFVPQKAIYKMRHPEKRRKFIKELGGTTQTEEAVEQALAWLHRTQSDDGRWDVDGFKTIEQCGGAGDLVNEDVGLTGLVLLAYLGAGYTHLDGLYQETVRKGLDWLLNTEKENGDMRGPGQMYGQAMATAALCESYSLTGDERLRAPTERAVRFILDSQEPGSGWRYMSHTASDTSVTGWQILALKSAQIAGFSVPDQTFQWMHQWLDKVRQGDAGGLYSYKPRHVVTPVMTAEGAFCQLFMGSHASAEAQAESIAFVMQNLPVWDPANRSVHIYYWYYATLTMYLSGAKEFAAWNEALMKALLDGRRKAGAAAGSWDPVCLLGFRGGRVYATAMSALCLEVYYRFLPLYKHHNP